MNREIDFERLTAFALGELPPADAAAMRALVANDADARAYVEETRALSGTLTQAFLELPAQGLSPQQRNTIAASAAAPLPPVIVGERPPVAKPAPKGNVVQVDFKERKGGERIWVLDWTLKVGIACCFFLTGLMAISLLGNKVSDIIGTLSVILPGAQTTDDHKLHSAQLVEFSDGNDDSYQILDTHIGAGDTNRLNRNTGLGDSNTDSIFIVQDVD